MIFPTPSFVLEGHTPRLGDRFSKKREVPDDRRVVVQFGRLGRGWGGPKSPNFPRKIGLLRGFLSHFEGGPSLPKYHKEDRRYGGFERS